MTDATFFTLQRRFKTRRLTAFAIPALIVLYLAYLCISFDIAGLAARARLDNARILLSDFVSYKTHVSRDNRTGAVTIAIEGEAKGTYAPGQHPDWVQTEGNTTRIDLGRGNLITYDAAGARYVVPGYGTIDIRPQNGKLQLTARRATAAVVDQRHRYPDLCHRRRRSVFLFPFQG